MIQAPCLPVEMPDLRNELISSWSTKPGWRIAEYETQILTNPLADQGVTESIKGTIRVLHAAELFWVGEEMCELLYKTINTVPDNTEPEHLTVPAPYGLVVFARPWIGSDSHNPDQAVVVDAILWGIGPVSTHPSRLPDKATLIDQSMVSNPKAIAPGFVTFKGLSVACYRCLRWENGLSKIELQLATSMTLFNDAKRSTHIGTDGSIASILHGQAWMPIGRTTWPFGDTIRGQMDRAKTEEEIDIALSGAEDRRIISTLFTLLNTHSLAQVNQVFMPRQVQRREERTGRKEPSKVKVIYLRRPERPAGSSSSGTKTVNWSHRWVQSAYIQRKHYGPKNAFVKLIAVPACVKGPDNKEIIVKETVKAWVR